METKTHILRAAPIILAVLMLITLLTFLAGARTHAAPLLNAGTGADPRIHAITVTSSLPISDTHPGDGVTKTVYFSNIVPGVITLTFEISGTPALTLTPGAAFDELERVYTSTNQTWTQPITYSVADTHTTQPNITYTAANTDGVTTTVAIAYVRDVTAPIVTVNVSSTWRGLNPIPVAWQAEDGQSGVARARLYYRLVPTDTTWQDGGQEQAGLSGAFYFTPSGYLTYSFAVQAADNLGTVNVLPTPGNQVVVEPFRIYLPLTLRRWTWWHQHDTYEPNDTREEAYGPLTSGQDYTSHIYLESDQRDYYTMILTSAGPIVVDLTVPACCDYDLYLYDSPTGDFIAASNYMGKGLDEHLEYSASHAGTYYILVYSPYKDYSSEYPYQLHPTFP